MDEFFDKKTILDTYSLLKSRKSTQKNKKLPIGIDGVSESVFEKNIDFFIQEIHRKLNYSLDSTINYSFGPLIRLERKKSLGGTRHLYIPRLRDQIVLKIIHNQIISSAKQKGIDLKIKSPYDVIKKFDRSVSEKKECWIIKTDISSFFDSIPRDKVINQCENLALPKEVLFYLKKWSDNLVVKNGHFNLETNKQIDGLPQGLSISSSLSELYAQNIDLAFNNNTCYFRYIDDIVIVCDTVEEAKYELNKLKKIISDLYLNLADNKTHIIKFMDGFEWLGLYHFPDRKLIHPDKIKRWTKPFIVLCRECIEDLKKINDLDSKKSRIELLTVEIAKQMKGVNNNRVKWLSLIDQLDYLKRMDSYIHQRIRNCYRFAKINCSDTSYFPSIYYEVIKFKKRGLNN